MCFPESLYVERRFWIIGTFLGKQRVNRDVFCIYQVFRSYFLVENETAVPYE